MTVGREPGLTPGHFISPPPGLLCTCVKNACVCVRVTAASPDPLTRKHSGSVPDGTSRHATHTHAHTHTHTHVYKLAFKEDQGVHTMAEYWSSEVGLKYVWFTGNKNMSRDQMIFITFDFNFSPMLKGNLQYRYRPSGAVLDTNRGSETEKEHQPLIYSRSKLVEKWLD